MFSRTVLFVMAFAAMTAVSLLNSAVLASESLTTRFGEVETVKNSEYVIASDTITVDGKIVYKDEGMLISLMEKFTMGEQDVVLFGTNCGGTACVNDDLHFLVLQAEKPPKVVADPDFISSDGTVKAKISPGRIEVDLGNEGGKSKTAVFDGEKVIIQLASQKKTPLSEKDCKWLFESGVDGQCIAEREEDPTCKSLRIDYFPGAVRRGIAAIQTVLVLTMGPSKNSAWLLASQASPQSTRHLRRLSVAAKTADKPVRTI